MRFDGTDPLCLDGERLIEVVGFRPGNAVVRAGEEEKEYRTQRTDGSRIIGRGYAGGVPTYFERASRDGRILRYGVHPQYVDLFDPERRLGQPARGQVPVRASWPLTQIRDRFGNRLDVLYEVEISGLSSEIYEDFPRRILYTGFGGELGLRSVELSYAPRGPLDRIDAWFAGTNRRVSRLLTRIETHAPVHVPSLPAGDEQPTRAIRYYDLQYLPSGATGRSLLQSVTDCEPGTNGVIEGGGDDVCMRPVTFGYEAGDPGFEAIDQDSGRVPA